MFDAHNFNSDKYDQLWNELNCELNSIRENGDGLPGVLLALQQQQFDQGFVQDDLSSLVRCRLCHSLDHSRAFTVQYNPMRANRDKGAGRNDPPPGMSVLNGACYLDRQNVRWQQRGIELGYDLNINNNQYIAWMNPFPLMPVHTTIARSDHYPQSWIGSNLEETEKNIQQILSDLMEITSQLPQFIGFYNGHGAGASIPHHFHFQFFKRPEGQEPFALEYAAARANIHPFVLTGDEYPITSIYFRGNRERVISEATQWVHRWTKFYSNNTALSANIVVTPDDELSDIFHLYFVPRNTAFSHAPGMVGNIGGLEVLGELVFTTELEKQHLDSGRVNFDYVKQVLSAVEAPGVREFVKKAI